MAEGYESCFLMKIYIKLANISKNVNVKMQISKKEKSCTFLNIWRLVLKNTTDVNNVKKKLNNEHFLDDHIRKCVSTNS